MTAPLQTLESPDGLAGQVMVLLVGLHNPRSNVPPYLERGFRQDRFRELEDITDQFVKKEEFAEIL